MLRARLLHALARLARGTDGSVTVEAVIMVPALIWCYLGTYVFFDAYRAQLTNVKTGYTLADTLSREEDYITDRYIDGIYALQQFLIGGAQPTNMRVSLITYDATKDEHRLVWSEARGGSRAALTTPDLTGARDRIPLMADGDVSLLVETWVDYQPPFKVGLSGYTYEDLVVVRPRYSRLCFNTVEGGNHTTAIC